MRTADSCTEDRIEIKIPCKAEYVRTVRRAVSEFAQSINMPQSAVEAVEIATSEAVANIVRHAYGDQRKPLPVVVICARGRGCMQLEVIDKGRGFNAPPQDYIPEIDYDREGGLGIILIKSLMDRVNYVSKPDAGTRIKMTKRAREAVARISTRTPRRARA